MPRSEAELVLLRGQPAAEPHTLRPKRHGSGGLASVADPTCSEDGRRMHRIDDLRHENHGRHLAAVSPRLVTLRHDIIDPGVRVARGLGLPASAAV